MNWWADGPMVVENHEGVIKCKERQKVDVAKVMSVKKNTPCDQSLLSKDAWAGTVYAALYRLLRLVIFSPLYNLYSSLRDIWYFFLWKCTLSPLPWEKVSILDLLLYPLEVTIFFNSAPYSRLVYSLQVTKHTFFSRFAYPDSPSPARYRLQTNLNGMVLYCTVQYFLLFVIREQILPSS